MFGESIVSNVVGGVSDYFKGKQELKKIELEADKKIAVAKGEAEVKRLAQQSEQNYDLDRLAIENMNNSSKDEYVLGIFSLPIIFSFFPQTQPYVADGFAALSNIPDWFMLLFVGIVVSIYGLRNPLALVIKMVSNNKNPTKILK
jgi:hypothetical protein